MSIANGCDGCTHPTLGRKDTRQVNKILKALRVMYESQNFEWLLKSKVITSQSGKKRPSFEGMVWI
jgi:phage antirepressor YoqD-like protein